METSKPYLRLEAFCDGVYAIAITLLVLDIKIPSGKTIHNSEELWLALKAIVPPVFAFALSFIIIFITWVNHQNGLKLVNKSSHPFIYANGFVLLTVVFIPFPTSLIGEYILTGHAGPAVFIYNAVIALQSVAWIVFAGAALKHDLSKNENSEKHMRVNRRHAYISLIVYFAFAIFGLRFPIIIAILTTLTWVFWLIFGIKMKNE